MPGLQSPGQTASLPDIISPPLLLPVLTSHHGAMSLADNDDVVMTCELSSAVAIESRVRFFLPN